MMYSIFLKEDLMYTVDSDQANPRRSRLLTIELSEPVRACLPASFALFYQVVSGGSPIPLAQLKS